jgi:hypothetical protein
MGRGQLWWAQGQLEELRRYCVNLARMINDFSHPGGGVEPYFKIDKAMQVEQLSPLKETFCPTEKGTLLNASITILHFYYVSRPGACSTRSRST